MATQRAARGLTRPPLAGAWALAPAAIILGLLVAAGMGYAVAQSLGALPLAGETDVGFAAYRRLLADGGSGGDLWASAGFTLWISAASTLVAACLALLAVGWLDRPRRGRGVAAGVLHLNLAIPHVVWAVALVLVLSQSGIVARIAAAVGLVGVPADFPIVVRDRFGLGIVIHYATKEAPFLTLVAMALSRAQPRELGVIAQSLGATGLRRVRLVTLPAVLPGLGAASALVFAFVFGAYEAPVVVGVTSPRPLSVLGLDLFTSADLARRPEAMALGVLMAATVVAILSVSIATLRRRRQ
jgi:putative spermidine/putrescine transport system permease protein